VKWKQAAAIAGAVVIIGGVAGCGSQPTAKPTPTPKPFDFSGTIEVPIDLATTLRLENNTPTLEGPCASDDGYSDIDEGTQVVVSNANGKKVALGTLEAGQLADGPDGDKFFESVCQYPFTVDDVPPGSSIYSVHIGNQARGDLSYKKSELEDGIALKLGS
jgi:hypothetical protein